MSDYLTYVYSRLDAEIVGQHNYLAASAWRDDSFLKDIEISKQTKEIKKLKMELFSSQCLVKRKDWEIGEVKANQLIVNVNTHAHQD